MLHIEAGTTKFGNRRSDLKGVPEFNGLLNLSVNPHQRKPHNPESASYVHPRIEMEIANRLGSDGFDVLNRLAEINDEFVARLCDRQRSGSLTDQDLTAARLAAKKVRR
jgi:hypothetical protein